MPKVLHIGPCETPGGMANVMDILASNPPKQWHAELLSSHVVGSKFAKWRAYRRARSKLTEILQDQTLRPDIIHIHTAADWSWWRKRRFAQMAHKAGVANIIHIHSGQFDSWLASSTKRARQFSSDIREYNSKVVVLSQSWSEKLSNYLTNSVVIENPMNPNIETGLCLERDSQKILFLARNDPIKGGDFAQNLVLRLRKKNPELVLAMSGISESRHSWVQPLGWMKEEDKRQHLETAAVLIVPSKFEGQPMVALEAIASGTPVLLSDTIHSLQAEIPKAKYGDLDDWQNHLERILSSSLPTYQDTLLKPYSLDTVQQSWKRLYESLLV